MWLQECNVSFAAGIRKPRFSIIFLLLVLASHKGCCGKMQVLSTVLILLAVGGWTSASSSHQGKATARKKRELPLNLACDVRSNADAAKCYKGDLIGETVADCKRKASWGNVFTCDPVDKYRWSTSVNVPDVNRHGVDCVPKTGLPVTCGTQDTRCVCDDPWDWTSPTARPYFANRCRCQYWPAQDERETTAVCKQYDHGGTSDVHFYACCNNCQDPGGASQQFCDGDTYQGGGTTSSQCGKCGQRTASQLGSRLTYTFNCKSCQQQRYCNDLCNEKHPLATVTPGLCPKWIGCFRGCCLDVNPTFRGKRSAQVNVTNFCGDGTCTAGETKDNCPRDCCPTVNPRCAVPAGRCGPRCCLDWGCCLVNETTVTVMTQAPPAASKVMTQALPTTSRGHALFGSCTFLVAVIPALLVG